MSTTSSPSGAHVCPGCGGGNMDWTVRDAAGRSWTVRFTAASAPMCTRCANPAHVAHGLPLRPRYHA